MSLGPGTRLGPYEIHSAIGAGGMGEVYQGYERAMSQRMRLFVGLLVAIATVFVFATPSSAQIRVIISGGFTPPYQKVLPEFERTTGIKVTTTPGMSQGDGPTVIAAQLRRGVPAD